MHAWAAKAWSKTMKSVGQYEASTNLIIIVQMFRILFDIPRSSIWHKDLLFDINPHKTLKNVHTKFTQTY